MDTSTTKCGVWVITKKRFKIPGNGNGSNGQYVKMSLLCKTVKTVKVNTSSLGKGAVVSCKYVKAVERDIVKLFLFHLMEIMIVMQHTHQFAYDNPLVYTLMCNDSN